MARLLAILLLLSALRPSAATQVCAGQAFLNQSIRDGCTLSLHPNASHCGFEVTPQYAVFDDRLRRAHCSHVVNPTPSGFEMICTSPPFLPSPARRLAADDPEGADDRRLTFFYDDNEVVTWTAAPPPLLERCGGAIDNLTDRIRQLQDELADRRACEPAATGAQTTALVSTTTTTETTGTRTTRASTTTTPEGATATQTSTSSMPPVLAAAAAAASDCDSPWFAIAVASLAANGLLLLLLLLLACVLPRRRPKHSSESQTAFVEKSVAAVTWNVADVEMNVEAKSQPVVSSALSVGSDVNVGNVQSAEQQPSDSWAGRSIVYRYLRCGPRSGNDIEAVSRRGWKMSAVEPPNMEDPPSAANSRALSGPRSRQARARTATTRRRPPARAAWAAPRARRRRAQHRESLCEVDRVPVHQGGRAVRQRDRGSVPQGPEDEGGRAAVPSGGVTR